MPSSPSASPAEHQRGILRSKSYAVAYGIFDLRPAPDIGNVVEVAVGIRFVQVDGGGNAAVLHCNQGGRDAGSSAGSLRMPNLRLQSGHWDLVGMTGQS